MISMMVTRFGRTGMFLDDDDDDDDDDNDEEEEDDDEDDHDDTFPLDDTPEEE